MKHAAIFARLLDAAPRARVTLFGCLLAAAGSLMAGLHVTFPGERQKLGAVEQTYVIGAADPDVSEPLLVNGVTTTVYRTGAFLQMVPVQPGANTIVVSQGHDRFTRTCLVAAPPKEAPKPFPLVDSDESPLLGPSVAWRTTGTIFQNRVRDVIDGSVTLHYLPRGFALRGAEVKGTGWVAVWLENRRGFLQKANLVRAREVKKLPSKGLLAPDVTAGFPDQPPYGKKPEDVTICVDAGHGGSDTGTFAPHGWPEKDVNLMQARAIRDALEKAGFQVLMTREGDTFPALYDRPAFANAHHVDAFISVHHNATAPQRDPREARHTTTYASTSNGLALARCIQKHVAAAVAPVKDAGAQMRSFAVCRNPCVPSCLIEVDFINLPEGEEASWDPARQRKVAQAVVCGVLDWMMTPAEPQNILPTRK